MILDPDNEEERERQRLRDVLQQALEDAQLAYLKDLRYPPRVIRGLLAASSRLWADGWVDVGLNETTQRIARHMLEEQLGEPAGGDAELVEGLTRLLAVTAPVLSSLMSISGVSRHLMQLAALAREAQRRAVAGSLLCTAVDVELRLADITGRHDVKEMRLQDALERLEEARMMARNDPRALAALQLREARALALGAQTMPSAAPGWTFEAAEAAYSACSGDPHAAEDVRAAAHREYLALFESRQPRRPGRDPLVDGLALSWDKYLSRELASPPASNTLSPAVLEAFREQGLPDEVVEAALRRLRDDDS